MKRRRFFFLFGALFLTSLLVAGCRSKASKSVDHATASAAAPAAVGQQIEGELSGVAYSSAHFEDASPVDDFGGLHMAASDLSVNAGPMTLRVERVLQLRPLLSGLCGSRWRLNWEVNLIQAGDMAMIQQAATGVVFNKNSDGTYASAAGDRLRFEAGRGICTRSDGNQETFDADGRLIERKDRCGNRIALKYNPQGLLERVEGPSGAFLQLATDTDGRVTKISSSSGAEVQYFYGSASPPKSSTDEGLAVTYRYSKDGALASIGYPDSKYIHLSYDAQNRVTGRQLDIGAEKFEYNDADHSVNHIDASGRSTITRWSADRRQKEVTDALGSTTKFAYDNGGREVESVSPTGDVTKTTYDARGRVAAIDGPLGRTTFEYQGESQRVSAVVDPTGSRRTFRYDDRLNLIETRVDDDVVLQTTWHPNGMLKSLHKTGDPVMNFAYNAAGQLETLSDSAGHTSRFEYDRFGNRTRSANPAGAESRWTYDSQGRMLSETDAAGATTQWQYGPGGRVSAVTDANGKTSQFHYDSNGRLAKMINADGRAIQHEYDSQGRVIKTSRPDGGEETFAYDRAGNIASATFANGAKWTFTYDAIGNILSESGPLKYEKRYRYDAAGRLIEERDALDRAIQYGYDKTGKVSTIRSPAGESHRKYGPQGELLSVTNTAKRDVTLRYDQHGELLGMSGPSGQLLNAQYNQGRVSKLDGPAGTSVSYSYDNAGRETAHRYANGEAFGFKYDPLGRITEASDALGRAWKMSYSPRGELTSIVGPDNARYRYTYSPLGQLTRVIDPRGGIRQLMYDSAGRRTGDSDPLGRENQLSYDAAGHVRSVKLPDGTSTTFEYDLLDRVAKVIYATGPAAEFSYDAVGNLARETQGDYRAEYKYDDSNRLIEASYQPANKTLRYQYDEQGHRAALEVVGIGSWKYKYDSQDLLTELHDPQGKKTTFQYDDAGRVTRQQLPNGIVLTRSYDGRGRTLSIAAHDANNKAVVDRKYEYDKAGNLVREMREDGKKWNYEYDKQNCLIAVRGPEQSTDVRYDEVGNILRSDNQAQYDAANQLQRFGAETFRYDQAGRMTRRDRAERRVEYEYDGAGRLLAVKQDGKPTAEFGYDSKGRRIWKKVGSKTMWFVYDGPQVLLELDDAKNVARSWTLSPQIDEPIGFRSGNTQQYLIADQIGSVVAATDEKGSLTGSWDYQPFGELRTGGKATPTPPPIGFSGRDFDAEAGLYYYRARYYDPQLGRFLTPDPVGGQLANPATQHPYQYAYNNPLRFRDPMGTFTGSDVANGISNVVGEVGHDVGYGVGYGVGYALTSPARAYNWATGNSQANARYDNMIDNFARNVTGSAMDTVATGATGIVTDRLRVGEAAGDLKGGTWDAGKSATWTQLGLTGVTEVGRGYGMAQTTAALARPVIQQASLATYKGLSQYGKSVQRAPTEAEAAAFKLDKNFKGFQENGMTVVRPGLGVSDTNTVLAHEGFHALLENLVMKIGSPRLTAILNSNFGLFWNEMTAYSLDAIYRATGVIITKTPGSLTDIAQHILDSGYDIGKLWLPTLEGVEAINEISGKVGPIVNALTPVAKAAGKGSEVVAVLNGQLGLTKPDEVPVPYVRGMSQSAANLEIEKAGLKRPDAAYLGQPADPKKGEQGGTVQFTVPPPGAPAPRGSKVAVTLFREPVEKKDQPATPTSDTNNQVANQNGENKPGDNQVAGTGGDKTKTNQGGIGGQTNPPGTGSTDTKTKAVVVPNAVGKLATEANGMFSDDFNIIFHADGPVPAGSEDKLRVYSQNPKAGSTQFKTGIQPIHVLLATSVDGKDPYNPTGQNAGNPTTPPTEDTLPVPSAIGKSVTEAFAIISKDFVADFKSDDEQTLPADHAEDKMRVISQSPAPDTPQKKGTKVMMIIRQLDKGVVPNVIGLSKEMASQRVAGSGLKPSFKYAEGFVEADDPGLASMRVTAQTPGAGMKIADDGEVAMVLIRSNAGSSTDTTPPETPPETPPPNNNNPATLPEELRGPWTGELVVTDVSKNLPEGCDASMLNKGKPFPMEMSVGAPNEKGEGKLSVGGAQNGKKEETTMPFSFNPQDGAISFSQSHPNGMKITFEGHCTKSQDGNVMDGTFSVEQGGQMIFRGNWKSKRK